MVVKSDMMVAEENVLWVVCEGKCSCEAINGGNEGRVEGGTSQLWVLQLRNNTLIEVTIGILFEHCLWSLIIYLPSLAQQDHKSL
ncbi:hypothetical protein Syun_001378 [Stephania yunnanensis]|uniref:Uncharacterized protein n=1 Tax=Stephania yunnanensis TaxID=152371 RepID=A0AAP0Q718_9MAGN